MKIDEELIGRLPAKFNSNPEAEDVAETNGQMLDQLQVTLKKLKTIGCIVVRSSKNNLSLGLSFEKIEAAKNDIKSFKSCFC